MSDYSVQLADWQDDKEDLIAVRTRVFVDEQKVPPELELDNQDSECTHFKALDSDSNIIGTARLLPNGYVGRMCVLKPHRNAGIGGLILQFIITHAQQQGFDKLALNSQKTALNFYARYGFEADSDIFMEAGIEHVHMTLLL